MCKICIECGPRLFDYDIRDHIQNTRYDIRHTSVQCPPYTINLYATFTCSIYYKIYVISYYYKVKVYHDIFKIYYI